MKKLIASSAALVALVVPATGQAAGHSQNGFTVGDCISDVVYGNEPNSTTNPAGGPSEQEPGTKGGTIVPTQSPGPFVNNPNDPTNPTQGRSVGEFRQDGINIPELCQAAAGQ